MGHLGLGRGFYRLNRIGMYRLSKRLFETSTGFVERKGVTFRCSLVFEPTEGLRESDDDPSYGLSDCHVGVGPVGLHKPYDPRPKFHP